MEIEELIKNYFGEYLKKYQPQFKGNPEHLKILLIQGVEGWNKWRGMNNILKPNLQRVILTEETVKDTAIWLDYIVVDKILGDTNLEKRVVLSKINLQNTDISQANLQKAILENANLQKTILWNANLQKADLENANLKEAAIMSANLQKADLWRANLQKTILWRANLQKTILWNANLQKTILWNANLQKADLSYANLQKTDLMNTNFEKACLYKIRYKKTIIKLCKKNFWQKNTIKNFEGIRIETAYGNPEFKRFAQDMDYLEQFKKNKPIRYWIWNISCLCGQSFLLWALWSIIIAFFFGLVFAGSLPNCFNYIIPHNCLISINNLLSSISPSLEGASRTALTPYYFSIVTFTTLGFGDVTPSDKAGEIWVAIEVILGYIMLGGLISIFANKLARRS